MKQGMKGDAHSCNSTQDLRTGRHEYAPSGLQVDHVRARVDYPERPVDLVRVRERPAFEPLTEHDLENVPRKDVLLGLIDCSHEIAPGSEIRVSERSMSSSMQVPYESSFQFQLLSAPGPPLHGQVLETLR
jgi:hypothetical protein